MVIQLENLIEVSSSLAMLSFSIFFIVMSFQVVSFFKKILPAIDEAVQTMKIYQELAQESTVAVKQGQEILEAGQEISGDVIEAKRTISATGSAICNGIVETALEMLGKQKRGS